MFSQELEQCLLQKEEELRLTQSQAAEMEEDLNTVLQEKQVIVIWHKNTTQFSAILLHTT